MALIKETGAGLANANSYADKTDGDAYAAAHLYAAAWTAATDPQKESALQMATRTIDASVKFNGKRATPTQALQWPRYGAIDPDMDALLGSLLGNYFPSDAVPKGILEATCELAIALLTENRTTDPDGRGLRRVNLGRQELEVEFDRGNERQILPDIVSNMLARFGEVMTHGNSSGMVKLSRA